MTWETGQRELKRYESCNESFQDFYSLWKRKYKVYPTYELAHLYAGGDRVENWMRIVNVTYPKYL